MASIVALPRATDSVPSARTRLRFGPEWLALAAYVILLAVAIPYHEPWADEVQAWQLAGHASILDLFTNYLRHEGHPGLWYVLLYVLERCGITYTGLQWFTGMIAATSASIVIFRAPFPRPVRLALPFTFFLAYQYAVVARSYVLAPLLLFSAIALWKNKNALIPAFLLGLLANVCLHCTMLSLGLAVLYCLEVREGSRTPTHRKAAILVFLVLVALAVFTVLPQPRDLLVSTPLDNISGAHVPFIWALRSILFVSFAFVLFPWYCGVLALGVLAWALRGSVRLRYLLPLVLLASFGGYYFAVWHIGLVFITYIALAWIAWPLRFRTERARIVAKIAALALIVLHVTYTAHAVIVDHYLPYSGDLNAAKYLSPFVKSRTPMAVTYVDQWKLGAYYSIGLRLYLRGPIFINEPDPFWHWSTGAHSRVAFESALKQHPPVVVVEYYDGSSRPFTFRRQAYSRSISHLTEEGYVLTQEFCGIRPQGLVEKTDVCHLIFELPSQQIPRVQHK